MKTEIHILVIDTDADTLETCERHLSSRKEITITTCDGLAAMRAFGCCNPDIVLIELLMPERDGIELLLEIKRVSPQTKVLAMSGGGPSLTADFVLYLAKRLGADGTISKPIGASRLLETIEMISRRDTED